MKTRTRYLAGIAAGAVAITTGFVVVSQVQADEGTVDWQPCQDVEEDVLCGSIEVPLDWEDPDGDTIEIALAKREAANPDERTGSIVMDPGGPGGSGVEAVKGQQWLTAPVAENFDLVGFDPRGVANSTPVTCGEDALNEYYELRQPESAEEFDAMSQANGALYEDCKERSGGIIDHADNLQTVEDMDAIREALGEDKLDYLGYSYGSLMGQQYAEAYPENIRTMVLDGNMDHSITDPYEFVRSEVAPVEETFNQFVDWCEGTEECALYGEDVAGLYGDLKERARAGDLVDPETGDEMTFYDLSVYGFGSGMPEQWGFLADSLKALDEGEGELRAMQQPAQEAEVNDVYHAAWCGDWSFDISGYEEWEGIRDRLSEEFPNIEWTNYVDHALACEGTGVEHQNPQAELEIDEDTSMVMIGNYYDPATVYEWNVTAAEQSGANLVTYEGYGHTIYSADGASECVNEAIEDYFINETEPEEGLSCEAMEEPGVEDTRDSAPKTVGPYATV